MTFTMRIAIGDRPGSLARIAEALGSVGANIVELDVLERSVSTAVDQIVVEAPGVTGDEVRAAVEGVAGAEVDGAPGAEVAGAGSPLASRAMSPASAEWVLVAFVAAPAEAAVTAAPAATARTAARPRSACGGAGIR